VARITTSLEQADLELVERACRLIARQAAHDAVRARGTSAEKLQKDAEARWLGVAERIKAARNKPDPEPPPANVRPIRKK
jgi:hypothetical protein